MEKYPFPSFNYPFYPDGSQDLSFLDYGSSSTLNLDIDKNDFTLAINSKQQHDDLDKRGRRLVGVHPTIPLLPPCNTAFPSKVLPEVYRLRNVDRTNFRTTIISHVGDFCRDHEDIAFASSIDFIGEELGCKPWDPKCISTCFSNTSWSRHKQRHRLSPKFDLNQFCDAFFDNWLGNNVKKLQEGLGEAFLDIPPQLVFDLLDESIEQLKDETLHFDILQGNTVSYCKVPGSGSSSEDGILLYPSGPTMETLSANVVKFRNSDCQDSSEETSPSVSYKPSLHKLKKEVEVFGAIRQISSESFPDSGTFVATRSRHQCSFFKVLDINDSSQLTMELLDCLENVDQPVSLAVSPYIPGETVIVMKSGQVHLWRNGQEAQIKDVPSLAIQKKWPWYQSVFAGHPRCVLIANSTEANLMDFRANKSYSRNLFSITSKQVNIQERISAVGRNPQNTHHYLIATDQSLMVMDDRFIQHPVLKWRHHLQDPVQFINVIPDVLTDSSDSVVMVAGSYHHETHCYQYNSGQYEARYTSSLTGNSVMTPPISTMSPWKVSSFDEWPSLLPKSSLLISTVIQDRLADPLIGICGIPMTSQQGKNGFSAIQMSASGDLFHQPFIPLNLAKKDESLTLQDTKGNIEPCDDTHNLRYEDFAYCRNWIKEVSRMDQENCNDREWPLKCNMFETDCTSLYESMTSLDMPHPSCILCVDNANTISRQPEIREDVDEGCVCPRCGLNVNFGIQLKKSQQSDSVCSSKSCRTKDEYQELKLVTDAELFQDPVSKCLFKNWFSEIPIPLNMGKLMDSTEKPEPKTPDEKTSVILESTKTELKNPESNIVTQTLELPPALNETFTEVKQQQWPSPSKSVNQNQVTSSIKRAKRKLDQSMGF